MKKIGFLIITFFSAQLSSASYARGTPFNKHPRPPARSIGPTTHKPPFSNKKHTSPAKNTARKVADDIRAVGAESFEGGGAAPAVVVAGKSLI